MVWADAFHLASGHDLFEPRFQTRGKPASCRTRGDWCKRSLSVSAKIETTTFQLIEKELFGRHLSCIVVGDQTI